MESETFVNSPSPTSQLLVNLNYNDSLMRYDSNLTKNDVRKTINPILKKRYNTVIALPLTWYDYINNLIQSNDSSDKEKKKYVLLKKRAEHYMFPKIVGNLTIINIEFKNVPQSSVAFHIWLEFYELPQKLQYYHSNKIYKIQLLILKYLKLTGSTRFPFTFILSFCSISTLKIKQIRDKLASKIRERKSKNKPLFTIHLQDKDAPFVFFWMDTENVCSFNLSAMNSPQAYVNFANTFIQFFNFTLSD